MRNNLLFVCAFLLMAHTHLLADLATENDIDLVFMQEADRGIEGGANTQSIEPDTASAQQQQLPPVAGANTDHFTSRQTFNATASQNYFVEAGAYYGVDPRLLWCVAKVESRLNPLAVNKNKNGTYDIGMMQINTVHLPTLAKYGISKEMLFDTRTSIFVGAWWMSQCIRKHGMTKDGITCYNGRIKDNPYADKVLKIFYQQEAKYASR